MSSKPPLSHDYRELSRWRTQKSSGRLAPVPHGAKCRRALERPSARLSAKRIVKLSKQLADEPFGLIKGAIHILAGERALYGAA